MKIYIVYCMNEHFQFKNSGHIIQAENITSAQNSINTSTGYEYSICIAMPCYIENLMILKEKGTTFVGDYATAWTTLCSVMDFTYIPARGYVGYYGNNDGGSTSRADGVKTLKVMFEELHGVGSLPTNTA